ncbi:Ribonuclease kappa-B [Eumeta japonica]|uniref:Ribonuclease kappa-B n=1 Tax=Eumeta variegata TaxID=151549 RepID=A0A4C1UBG2_EUMVA|nr:Ribonuclease kappa-B [Eumeta japonica]
MKVCGPKLSLCCLVLSVWGIVQLTLMGVFYYIEAVALLEDIPLDESHNETTVFNIEEFKRMAQLGYSQVGIESVTLIEDAAEEKAANGKDFLQVTTKNYKAIASNCWIAATMYFVTLLIAVSQCVWAQRIQRAAQEKLEEEGCEDTK